MYILFTAIFTHLFLQKSSITLSSNQNVYILSISEQAYNFKFCTGNLILPVVSLLNIKVLFDFI